MLYGSGYFRIDNFYGYYLSTHYSILKEMFINPIEHQEAFYDWIVHSVIREQYRITTLYVPVVDYDVGKCLLDVYRWTLGQELNSVFQSNNFNPVPGSRYKLQVLGPDLIISKGIIHVTQ